MFRNFVGDVMSVLTEVDVNFIGTNIFGSVERTTILCINKWKNDKFTGK